MICTSSSQCLASGAVDSASVNIFDFHAPRARRHPWHSDAICFQSPTRLVGGHSVVLDICDELAVISVVSTQCSVVYAVDSIFIFDAPVVRKHHWSISALYYDAYLLGCIRTDNDSIHSCASRLLCCNINAQLGLPNTIPAVACLAAVHVGCTWAKDTFHISLPSMGGYWHSWGVCYQDGTFAHNVDSIVDADANVVTEDSPPATKQTSQLSDWELFIYLMGVMIVGLSVIAVVDPVQLPQERVMSPAAIEGPMPPPQRAAPLRQPSPSIPPTRPIVPPSPAPTPQLRQPVAPPSTSPLAHTHTIQYPCDEQFSGVSL